MITVAKTPEFIAAFEAIRDDRASARITSRIDRLAMGNPGDVKPVGHGVSEMRVNYGPGYRVYFTQTGKTVILLLTCGTKSRQSRDVKRAIELKRIYT